MGTASMGKTEETLISWNWRNLRHKHIGHGAELATDIKLNGYEGKLPSVNIY